MWEEIKIINVGEAKKMQFFCEMCLRLYDNQSKVSTYKGLTYLKNRVATNQKSVIEAHKPKRTEI